MSVLSQFTGGERISSLVGTPTITGSFVTVNPSAGATTALSGAMTSTLLKTALTVTGRGRINWVSISANDTTSRTLRMKITIDDAVVRDFTSAAITTTYQGFAGIGLARIQSEGGAAFQPLRFYSSLLIEIASSLTETDKATFAYNYEVFV